MDYRTSDYPTTSSTVLLSLLLEHSNDIALQGAEPSDLVNSNVSESEDNRVWGDRVPKTENGLSAVDNNLDYENLDDLKNYSSNKKRRTNAEQSVTLDVEPTTKRGLPPTDFTNRSPKWYYITKSDNLTTTAMPSTESTEKDASIETTKLDVNLELTTADSDTEYTTTESVMTDLHGEGVTMLITSTPDQETQSDTSKSTPLFIPAVTPIFTPTERSGVTLPATLVTDPETNSVFETISEAINETSESPGTFDKTAESPSTLNETLENLSTFNGTSESPSTFNETSESPSTFNETSQSPSTVHETSESPSTVHETSESSSTVSETSQSPSTANETWESPSTSSTATMNTVGSSSIGDVITTPIGTSVPVTLTSSTEPTVMKSESTSTKVPTTESLETSTSKEKVSTSKLPVTDRSKTDRRRERIGPGTGSQFGRKVSRRPFNRNYFTELRETSERRTAEELRRRTHYVRAQIPSSRGKHRYNTITTATSTQRVEEHHTNLSTEQPNPVTSTVKTSEIPTTSEQTPQTRRNTSDHINESRIVEEKDKSEMSTVTNQTEKRLDVEEEEAEGRPLPLTTTENSEVTTLKSTRITSRTSAALSTRLRKVSTTVAPREASLSNPRRTTLPEPKIPAKDVIIVTEEPKRSETVDQSSRAQELAVTLTDPPPSQASSTGRLPTRESLRRKISTTVAPRADTTTTTTTSRSTVRFRGRLKNKKEKSLENVTTRPRRPAIVDYDYYEDELEPVVAKSTLNGKLFLTSRGTIRCLDQGNFPHPYSCKKFITCARMVNGQVIGAEYTCPNKLSFDPIGGICNWSAGLGCKE